MNQSLPLFPERASSFAGGVDTFFVFLIIVAVFFSVLVGFGIFYFSFRYRRTAKNPVGKIVEGSHFLEIAWMVGPFVIAMFMFAWGARLYVTMRRPPSDALNIYVVGKQWMWKMQHSDGRREFDELHVPVNRDIELTMISEDAIHDFFVPAFRVKMDVLPGRYSTMWFRPTKTGRYRLLCSQYCGTDHSLMNGWVTVMEPSEYQAWLTGASANESLEQAGQSLFTGLQCVVCHGEGREPGAGPRAPSLRGVYGSKVKLTDGQIVVADEAYLRDCILDPAAKRVAGYEPIMPSFQGILNEEQLLELISYIKSLGAPLPGEQASGTGVPGTSNSSATPAVGRNGAAPERTKERPQP